MESWCKGSCWVVWEYCGLDAVCKSTDACAATKPGTFDEYRVPFDCKGDCKDVAWETCRLDALCTFAGCCAATEIGTFNEDSVLLLLESGLPLMTAGRSVASSSLLPKKFPVQCEECSLSSLKRNGFWHQRHFSFNKDSLRLGSWDLVLRFFCMGLK